VLSGEDRACLGGLDAGRRYSRRLESGGRKQHWGENALGCSWRDGNFESAQNKKGVPVARHTQF
jgi:hypothetical protein